MTVETGGAGAGRPSCAARRFGFGRCLEIVLSGQNKQRRRRDQEQIVSLGSRVGHFRIPRVLPVAAVAPPPSRAGLPSGSGRPASVCCRLRAVAGARAAVRKAPARTAAAVSRAASIWFGCNGLALIATRSRLVSDGKCGAGRLSLAAAMPAQIAAIAVSSAPTAANAQNVSVMNFDPAKQRHGADEAGGDQENAGSRKQPGRDGVGGEGAGRLVGPVAQIRPVSPA